MKKLLQFAVPLAMCATLAHAGIVFERAMPTGPGVNNPISAQRSNVKWAPGAGASYFIGDDFTLATDDTVHVLSVWMVADNPGTTDPSQELSGITLWGGEDSLTGGSGVLSQMATNPTVSAGPFNYFNPSLGIIQPIFKLTFSGFSWSITSNHLYDFGITTSSGTISLAASNAALSLSPQNYFDDGYLFFDNATRAYGGYVPTAVTGWDKGSDINVEISNVPEPSTVSLFLAGAAALAFIRRRRKA